MNRNLIQLAITCGFVLLLNLTSFSLSPVAGYPGFQQDEQSAEKKTDEDKSEKKAVETVDIESKSIQVYRTFDGRVESTQMSELRTDFKAWTDLEISEVTEEGSAVSAGQEVLKLDSEKLNKAISDANFAEESAGFALRDAELAMKEIEETFELDQELAERTWNNAKEDYNYYLKVVGPERLKDLAFDEKSSGYRLEYSKDELDQLEQMYTEDELTEESEEIVLKRARRSVESAQRSMDRSMLRIKKQREMEIPRDDAQKENEFKRASLEHDKSKITLPIKRDKAKNALAKAMFDLQNKKKSLAELEADRKKMTLTAPMDGILYYGRCLRGKWIGASGSAARTLEPGKKLAANKVVLTILNADKLMLRADLDESQLDSLAPQMKGVARINSSPNVRLPVEVKSVSRIPLDNNKFDCQLVANDLNKANVMPGMTCKMSFLVYENESAVVAPKSSVFSDDDGITNYVYLFKDGKSTKTGVTIGRTSGELVEITDGVSVGDKVNKAKP